MTRSDTLPMPTMEWLLERAIVTDAGCWEWQRARDRGYGRFGRRHGRSMLVHRYAWELVHGDPGDLHVLHRCDNPPCFNPDHLFLGTQADNNRDAARKGRAVTNPPIGEAHPFAVLSATSVRQIRELRAQGVEYKELARMFGVTPSTACKAAIGRSWRHVA